MRLIAVILPYAVSIRDFVHTGVLRELLTIPGVHIHIYTQNAALPEFDAVRSDRVSLMEIMPPRERRFEKLLKKLYPILFGDVFVFVQQKMNGVWHRRFAARALVGFRRLLGTRRALRFYGGLLKLVSARSDENLIAGAPDLVISTRSLVNSIDYPLVLEATHRGLAQITAASSWDNFTTKGFFPFPVAKIIVWNRQMANELIDIFEVPPEHIVVAGYPRVRLLQSSRQEDAASYLKRIGLGSYRRFILHTASYGELTRSAPGRPPGEYLLIREVAAALAPVLPADTCILVRLHPYSMAPDEAVFEGLERVHVFVPGRQDRYVERVMSREDEEHLSAQLRLSTCIISMASTITIDALSLDRPIINLGFDAIAAGQPQESIRRFYDYNHFRDLLRQVRPPVASSVEEVVDFVSQCIAGQPVARADQAAFERCYVPNDSAAYPVVVRSIVEQLLGARPQQGVDAA